MAGKELAVVKPKPLAKKDQVDLPVSFVYYEREGTTGYSFSKIIDQNRSVRIDLADHEYQESEFVGAEFDDEVKKSHKEYYIVAAASGVLTARLSSVRLSDLFELKDKLKDKDIEKYIVAAARIAGYKKSDYRGAVLFILNKAIPFVQGHIPPQAMDYFADLSNNRKVGLVFSIITQFTGERYRVDLKGKVTRKPVPDYYAIGTTPAEKILFGLLYWVFSLAANAAVSKKDVVGELFIPKQLISLLIEFLDIPLLEMIPKDIPDAERKFSIWIKKLFNDTDIYETDGTSRKFNLLQLIKDLALETIESSFPVMLNECLFRGFYFIKKLTAEMKSKNLASFDSLSSLDPHDILPFNNQVVSRMAVIASGSFVAADLTSAVIKALLRKKDGNGKPFANTLFAELNLAGIGRFAIAIGADSKYWAEDIRVLFVRKQHDDSGVDYDSVIDENPETSEVFKVLSLEAIQARLLYCFEYYAVKEDIARTKSEKNKKLKDQWLDEWKLQLIKALEYEDDDFFAAPLEELHRYLREQSKQSINHRWIYLLSMELALFKAYQPIGSELDNAYQKLKFDEKTTETVYLKKQKFVSERAWKKIKSDYSRHYGLISGNTQKIFIGAGISAFVIVGTGGLASIFAPQIAVVLAGEAVVGLHGAALTSASLAFVGGGAIAAGGGGMAAGAAIITGGGALIGAVGSGSGSVIAIMAQANPSVWARQGAKLSTFCSAVLHEEMKADAAISSILTGVEATIENVEKMIEEMENDHSDLDKDFLKVLKKYQQYLERTAKEIGKSLKA